MSLSKLRTTLKIYLKVHVPIEGMFLPAVILGKLYKKNKKTLWSFFMDGVQLSQGNRATMRRQFTFYHKSPKIPGTHLIDPGRMKGWVNLGATQWF